MTTVDYIIASLDAISIISSCKTLPMMDLNMSDYLPLVPDLSIGCPVQTQPNTCIYNSHPRLDWEQAIKSGEIKEYRRIEKQYLSGLNSLVCFDGMEDIEATIFHLSNTLKDMAEKSLPEKRYKKSPKWKDETLSALCAHNRVARQTWKENGCPKEGLIYEQKRRLRREIK